MKKVTARLLTLVVVLCTLIGCGNTGASTSTETKEKEEPVQQEASSESSESEAASQGESQVEEAELEETDKLVIYTANPDDEIAIYTELFEEKYGVEIEVVSAGMGELLKRVEAEAGNPLGDILIGGTRISNSTNLSLFEEYHSPEAENILPGCNPDDGLLVDYNQCALCFMVNDQLVGDIQINGFEDLLQPELKGKIAYADPAASSNAFTLLVNMLYDMGDGDIWSDKGWKYVEDFCKQLDGKILNSSSETPRAVANGEYIVGLNLETNVLKYIKQGYPVSPRYMSEGTFVSEVVLSIIKGAPNLKNAQRFVDMMIGEEMQTRNMEEMGLRSIRKGIPSPEGMTDTSEINVVPETSISADDKVKILDRFNELRNS